MVVGGLFLALAMAAADAPARQELSLNGTWQCQIVTDLDRPPAAEGWSDRAVPGYLEGTDYRRAWFRRSFAVPVGMQGQRIKIRFGGVKYNSRVLVNGQAAGGCFGGYQPFEVDVTRLVRFDRPNQILVGCHDWTGVFAPGKVDFSKAGRWDQTRSAPQNKVLSPVGGLYGLYGIWDDVTLVAHPALSIQSLFIRPSVRRGELAVEYTLANESDRDSQVELQADVDDRGRTALAMAATRVAVPAGKTASATLRQSWPSAPLWSPQDPHLLELRSRLSSGDRLTTRFGFREFWVEGHSFFLNGVKTRLLATSWWPPHGPMTREEVRKQFEAIKACGCVAFRTHTQPWPAIHYDVADELGLLMVVEGAVWNDDDIYRVHDPVFWQHYGDHLRAMVLRDRNRPSVVMWSLENEFFGGVLNDRSSAKADLVRMGRLVKEADPTRPIFFESDGDPDGIADAIGIHYPHEYPDYTCWPNEADWLIEPQKIGHMFLNGQPEFIWKTEKPLYVGEFLWIPSRDPSWHTVFFGDEAYRDYHRYRNLAKAESWRMQILGYRRWEVAGISPWTVIEGGPLDATNPLYRAHQYAYQPVAAYCRNADRRFYPGERVERKVDLFNDSPRAAKLVLSWSLARAETVYDRGALARDLGAGEQIVLKLALSMPEVKTPTPVDWRVRLSRDGQETFSETHHYHVVPQAAFPPLDPVGLYDPEGTTRTFLQSRGVKTSEVAGLDRLQSAGRLLVIGVGAFRPEEKTRVVIGRVDPRRKALLEFVRSGGRLLVLHQETYPEGLLDAGLTNQRSTMTFALRSSHPALDGVGGEDLKFWRGDHLVATRELARPAGGGFLPILVSGSAAGVDTSPLLEQRIGRGAIVYCQLLPKQSAEPAAARILANVLRYLALARFESRPVAVAGNAAYRDRLRELGLEFQGGADSVETVLKTQGVLIVRGADEARTTVAALSSAAKTDNLPGQPAATALAGFVRDGGTLLLHRPGRDLFEAIDRELKLGLTRQPYTGAVTRAEGRDPLVEAIAREDLYWLGPHVGIDWAETPRADRMCAAVYAQQIDAAQARRLDLSHWQLSGTIVQRRGDEVVFATNGEATAEIEFPKTGRYLIGLEARGTPADGTYPVARISLDGQAVGQLTVGREAWHTLAIAATVFEGRHRLGVAFVNDGSRPPHEDRNLYLRRVLLSEDRDKQVSFLANPGAAVVVRRGQGRVILDEIAWDTDQSNARKATRYAGSLLTALDAPFRPQSGTAIQCETMTPQPGMPHFHNYGSHVGLACSGCVRTEIEVAAAGRYAAEVVASGTQAAGVYPLVEVRLDGKALGQVQLNAGSWRSYRLPIGLPAGKHQLELAFVNDFNRDGEDRNLMLDRIVIAPETD